MVVELEEEMIAAADDLRFEYAAQLRDEIRECRRELREVQAVETSGAEAQTVEAPSGEVA